MCRRGSRATVDVPSWFAIGHKRDVDVPSWFAGDPRWRVVVPGCRAASPRRHRPDPRPDRRPAPGPGPGHPVINAATGELLRALTLDPRATTSPPDAARTRTPNPARPQAPRTLTWVRGVLDVPRHHMERANGIEPSRPEWKAATRPCEISEYAGHHCRAPS